MDKFGRSDNRTPGHSGHCPALSGVWQPDGHGHPPRYMSCLSRLSGVSAGLTNRHHIASTSSANLSSARAQGGRIN